MKKVQMLIFGILFGFVFCLYAEELTLSEASLARQEEFLGACQNYDLEKADALFNGASKQERQVLYAYALNRCVQLQKQDNDIHSGFLLMDFLFAVASDEEIFGQ